ncbi:phosphomannose isomerase type II C-terminal cupin domain [Streptacidiphilus sp. EB129]|uniref:phosphomannose isomerase type II C-terminal cupin domain n=1 Tax=Streptacidiphilus sp. EB129 TaxID=3156262 RepID=UPI0035198A15
MSDPALARRTDRPWGHYVVLKEDDRLKLKEIVVHPGARLSYQRHERRSEHWVVVRGQGTVTLDGLATGVLAGSTVSIAAGAVHRVQNTGAEDLVFVEVQLGDYFGEDDIERIEDDYGR